MRKFTKKIISTLNDRKEDRISDKIHEVQEKPASSVPIVTTNADDESPTTSLRKFPSAAAIVPPPIITTNDFLRKDQMVNYPRFLPSDLPLESHLQFVKIQSFGTSMDTENKPYTVYVLEVRSIMTMPSSWTVYRRFSQFCRLRQTLQDLDRLKLPELPPRSHEFSMEQTILRKHQLESWLYSLMEMHLATPGMEPLIQNEQIRKFFTEGFNMQPDSFVHRYASPRRIPSDLSTMNTPASPGGSKVSIHDFHVVTTIGKGAFGQVFLVKSKRNTTQLYAMKSIRRKDIIHERQYEIIDRERRIMQQLHCPFIVEMHFVLKTKESLFFILDYCAGGELLFHLSKLGRFSERMARFYCAELCLALEYLHDRDIVYRDLKPENILLSAQGHVKLVDFGLARSNVPSYTEGARTYCGTEQYLAPEVLDRREYGKAIDWWALGMILYEMLTGLPPWYNADNRHEVFAGIRYGVLKFPRYISRLSALFIQALLTRDPSRRLGSVHKSATEVKEHPYFHDMDWIDLMELQIAPPMIPCASQQDVQCAKNFDAEFTSIPVDAFCHWDELEDVPENVDFSASASYVVSKKSSKAAVHLVDEGSSDEEGRISNEAAPYSCDFQEQLLPHQQQQQVQFLSTKHYQSVAQRQLIERGLFIPSSPLASSSVSTPSSAATTLSAFSSESISSNQSQSIAQSSYCHSNPPFRALDVPLAQTPLSSQAVDSKKSQSQQETQSQQYRQSEDRVSCSGRSSDDYVEEESREEQPNNVSCALQEKIDEGESHNSTISLPCRKSNAGFTLSPQAFQSTFRQLLRLT